MTFCSNCGTQLPDEASFCTNCGTAVKKETIPQPEAFAPEAAAPENTAPEAAANTSESFQTEAAFDTEAYQNTQTESQGFQQDQNTYQQQDYQQQDYQQQDYQQQNYQYNYQNQPYQQPVYVANNDHTADFEASDISNNKVIAMAAYLLGTLGIIIALLAAKDSPYASFHSRQALKLEIVEMLLTIVSCVLFFTILVPIAGVVCIAIVFVVRIICFFQVASGKAKDAPIVGSLPFLK